MRADAAVLLMGAFVAGCGGSMSGGGTSDVSTFAGTAGQIAGAASSYATTAGATADVPSCQSAHAAYDAQVRPMVDRMRSMGGAMDDRMASMGHPEEADMMCGVDAMSAELAHHDAAACASVDGMPANHAESARHAAAMEAWADHERIRADDLDGMMGMMDGMGGGGGRSTPACHRNGDGTFTLGP